MGSVTEYNITLGSESPVFNYLPFRDTAASQGWNSSYTGNTIYVAGLGSGTAYRRSQKDGAQIELDFDGTGLYLCYTAEGGSLAALTIDGKPAGATLSTDGTFCDASGAETLVVASGLPYGSHQALLNVSIPQDTASFLFYEAVVTVSAGVEGSQIASNAPHLVDDRDPGWSFGPLPQLWSVHVTSSDGDYEHTRTGTCTYSSANEASYTFTGAGAVYLMGGVANESFGFTITLDGQSASYNATNFWTSQQQILFFQGGLNPTTEHTITATNYNPSQPVPPDDGRACFNIDALGLIQSTPPSSGSAQSRRNAGLIAGIVVAAVLLILLAVLYWWYRRRGGCKGSVKLTWRTTPAPFVLPSTALDVEERREKSSPPTTTASNISNTINTSPPSSVILIQQPSPPVPTTRQNRRMTREELYRLPLTELVVELNERTRQPQNDSSSEAPPMYAPEA